MSNPTLQTTVTITCSDPYCPPPCRVFIVNRTPRRIDPHLLMALNIMGDCYSHGVKIDWELAHCPIAGAVLLGMPPRGRYPDLLPMFAIGDLDDDDLDDDLPIEPFLQWGRSRRGQRFFGGLVRRVGGRMLRLGATSTG